MDPNLQKQLSDLLSKLLTNVEAGAVWVGEQTPILVQEKLTYDAWSAIFVLVVIVLGTLVTQYLGYRLRQVPKTYVNDGMPTVFGWIMMILGGCLSTVLIVIHLLIPIKIYLAPRLYIVEWLRTGF